MLFELYDINLSPVTASALFGLLMGVIFGVAAQVSRFCLRRGLVRGAERRSALGTWVFALLVALLATQGASLAGWIDLSAHRFAEPGVPVLAIALGGLLFGAGMVLTRGCVSRLTVLAGGGNLRAVTVLLTFAIVAHATLKGVLAPVRTGLGANTVDLGDAAFGAGLPGGAAVWTAVLAVGMAALVVRSGARPLTLALAGLIGLLVPLGWVGTGVLLYDDFDPIALQTMSFTAPWADALFWTVASSSIPAGFGVGLVGGVILGAALSALVRGEARLESFEAPGQTLRYIAGGALMGFGGVLAGGCTVGAGLSGVSALSVAAMLALAGIVIGALATDRALDAGRAGQGTAVPAE